MVTRPCSLGRWLSYRERRSVVISVLHRLLILLAVASSAVAAAIFLLPPAASPAANMKLFAYVSEPNEPYNGIWLKDANGALVTHLNPGTYEIAVDDWSAGSSFHLMGPGVVYWQSRKPGARLPRGTKIGMRVSLGR